MHIKITVQGELSWEADRQVITDLEALLGIIVPHMIDNVKIEMLVDGLPY
jgi:hypothetical protein